jgi:peptide/nickel transport system permease protein
MSLADLSPSRAERPSALRKIRDVILSSPVVLAASVLLAVIVLLSAFAPFLMPHDPTRLTPSLRLLPPDGTYWLGTDAYGRDLFSRLMLGGQMSLAIGISAAVVAVGVGLGLGLVAGYVRWMDGVLMRMVDGLMAIPNILLAIAIVTLWGAGFWTVLTAICLPEVPRVVRLVRSVVLSAREEPYVEAAIAAGSSTWLIMRRHLLPNTVAPLIVQGTYICASAILVEAILSFLGIGIPPEIPTWGNIMAEGRNLFRVFPHNILYPGIFLALTVLAVNMLGDGLRDTLDPKMAGR